MLDCDDGNLIDGDGCSLACEIEPGWHCENGTTSTPSQCVSLVAPVCHLVFIDDDFKGRIMCDEPVLMQAISDDDFSVRISGPIEPYKFSGKIDSSTGWSPGKLVSSFDIQFTLESSIQGNGLETFIVEFHNLNILVNQDGNPL